MSIKSKYIKLTTNLEKEGFKSAAISTLKYITNSLFRMELEAYYTFELELTSTRDIERPKIPVEIIKMDNNWSEIKRLVDFLLEIELDLAEFTILTPFPHTPIRASMEQEKRILHNNWIQYTGGEVVFRPAKISAERLQEMYYYAWDTFYADLTQKMKMAKLFMKVIEKEKVSGTYRRPRLTRKGWNLKQQRKNPE